VLAAYSNSFSAGFALDNRQLILQDPRVHAATSTNIGLILGHSYWWPYGESGLYRPVTTLSYLMNYAVFGNGVSPFGYHVVNLLLHAGVACCVLLLAKRLTGDIRIALGAAAIWAVIPLSTEAVTNIVGRADLIAAAALLVSFLSYLHLREETHRRRWIWWLAMLVGAGIGVFAKESAVALAGVVACYEIVVWQRERSLPALAWGAAAMAPSLLLMWYARAVVLGASQAAEFPYIDNPIVGAPFWTAKLTAVSVAARYLQLLVWPAHLSNDYSYAQIPPANGTPGDWIACLVIGILAIATVVLCIRRCIWGFPLAFAFITFLPASNLLFSSGTIMAERLMYLPSAGFAILAAAMIFAGGRRLGSAALPWITIAIILVALTGRTWIRNQDWHDDLTLWTSAVSASPSSVKAHRALAEALYDADSTHANLAEVIAEAERSVDLVAALPDDKSDLQTYRQAAAYYLDRATALRQQATVQRPMADEAQSAYRRAETLLTRCLAVISATSRHIDHPSTAPEADAQRLLTAARLGVDDGAGALVSANRARELDPLNVLGYRLSADALLANQRPDDAAITLTAGSMITGDRGLAGDLAGLYRNGLDAVGCALTGSATSPVLNPECPLVRAHSCAAAAQAIAVNRRLNRQDAVERIMRVMQDSLKCSS
jgi:hypothetical protein